MKMSSTESSPIFILEPQSQSEIISALQKLKERHTVVLNLANLAPTDAEQAADMMAGCSCAIEGQATWIAKSTYMYTPNNVRVARGDFN